MADTSKSEDWVEDIAQHVHDENSTADQFAVSQTPYHTHNKTDSSGISYQDLDNRDILFPIILPGTSSATAGNYGMVFIAPYTCTFVGANEAHGTKGTDGSTVTLQIEKLTGTVASGSGITLMSAGFNLKGNINTIQYSALASIPKLNFSMKKGDRLGLVLTGTPTSVAQLVVTVLLRH